MRLYAERERLLFAWERVRLPCISRGRAGRFSALLSTKREWLQRFDRLQIEKIEVADMLAAPTDRFFWYILRKQIVGERRREFNKGFKEVA